MRCVAAHRYGINIEDKKTPFEVLYFPPKKEAHNYKNSRKNLGWIRIHKDIDDID